MDPSDFPPLDMSRRTSNVNSLRHQIANHIRAMLTAGKLTPGAFIWSESGLARHLGTNRETVNHAYRSLSDVLEGVKGVGWRVRPFPQWAAVMKHRDDSHGPVAVTGFPDQAAADDWGLGNETETTMFSYSTPMVTVAQFTDNG